MVRFIGLKKSAATKQQYEGVLTRSFMPFVADRGIHEPSGLTVDACEAWTKSLTVKANSKSTYFAVARAFCRWLVAVGDLSHSPMASVAAPETSDVQDRSMTKTQIRALLQASLHEGGTCAMVVHMLFFSGLRASELAALALDDLVLVGEVFKLTVRNGKGGKKRTIMLSNKMTGMIRRWKFTTASRGHTHVFPSPVKADKPISRGGVWSQVKKAAKRVDLAHVSPHFLRHAFASRCLDAGAPLHVVRQDLGHASLNTTSRYVHAQPESSSSAFL